MVSTVDILLNFDFLNLINLELFVHILNAYNFMFN